MDIKDRFQKLKNYYIAKKQYRVSFMNETAFQVWMDPKSFNVILFIFLIILFVFPAIMYLLFKLMQCPELYRTYELRGEKIYSDGKNITDLKEFWHMILNDNG